MALWLTDPRLTGKTAIVTGGARGLGFEMTRAFCEAGCTSVGEFWLWGSPARSSPNQVSSIFSQSGECWCI